MQQPPFGSGARGFRPSVLVRPADWYRNMVARGRINGLSVFAVTTAGVFALFCVSNLFLFRTVVYLDYDFAADAILTQKAEDFTLLTGHYSWSRFNHPGPFFFYVRGLFGFLLGDILPTHGNAYLIGALFTSALFVGVTAFLAYGLVDSRRGAILALVATMQVLWAFDRVLPNPWIPIQLVAPFIAYQLALLHLVLGRQPWAAGLAAFCGAVLVHGHITLTLFVIPTFALAFVYGIVKHKDRRAVYLLSAGSVVGVFVLPVVLDLISADPDNLDKVLLSTARLASGPTVGLAGAGRLALRHLGSIDAAIYAVAAVLVIAVIERRHMMREIAAAAVIFLLMCGLFVAAASGLPKAIPWHPAIIFRGIVLGFLIVITCAGTDVLAKAKPFTTLAVCGALLLAIVNVGSFTSPYKGNPTVKQFADFIEQQNPNTIIVHRQEGRNTSWRMAIGTVFELRRRGRDVCFFEKRLAFMFTDPYICPPDQRGHSFLVSMTEDCKTLEQPCVITGGRFALIRLPPGSR